ncbi:hypothetical protein [Rathayibacter sp. VKM Ac-2760]|uniref:hypothetical protein n=1 Tax=Rathayibacter sp. VKM Ac-2760 TaxID=2609253 RepID=UPI001FC98AEB|nr:hypothetical protein [Rathayibacter sp. VKM Ac-2760]
MIRSPLSAASLPAFQQKVPNGRPCSDEPPAGLRAASRKAEEEAIPAVSRPTTTPRIAVRRRAGLKRGGQAEAALDHSGDEARLGQGLAEAADGDIDGVVVEGGGGGEDGAGDGGALGGDEGAEEGEGDGGEGDAGAREHRVPAAQLKGAVVGVDAGGGLLEVLAGEADERAHPEAVGDDRQDLRLDERGGGDRADGGRDDGLAEGGLEVVEPAGRLRDADT